MSEPVRPEDLRISDVDRTRVQAHLHRAHDAGQLDLTEFDERVQDVVKARTRGELARITADLPELPPEEDHRRRLFAATGGGTAMRVLSTIWLAIAIPNVLVWGLLKLSGVDAYPWPVWLIVPGGVLAVLYACGVGRPPQR